MSWIYRKEGSSRRLELVAGEWVSLQSREAGVAESDDGIFRVRSLDPSPEVDVEVGSSGAELIDEVGSLSGDLLTRCVLVWGSARHQFVEGDVEREWRTEEARLALELERDRRTVALDLGGRTPGRISLDPIRRAVELYEGRSEAPKLVNPGSVVLGPESVASLAGALMRAGATVVQSPREGLVDGTGLPVEKATGPSGREWPNWFRPSYRTPPVRVPLDVELQIGSAESKRAGEPFTVVTRVEVVDDGVRAALVLKKEGLVHSLVLRGSAENWISALSITPGERTWFPLDSGTWGDWAIVRSDQLEVERFGLWIE